MSRILTILAATLIALPAVHAAQSEGGQHQRGDRKQQILDRFDTDKDGTLSESERAAAKAACKQRVLEKFDTDKDGKLSDSEREAARAAFSARLKEKHPELFAKVDTDGDGVISKAEGQAARAWLREHRGQGHGGADQQTR